MYSDKNICYVYKVMQASDMYVIQQPAAQAYLKLNLSTLTHLMV